VELRKIMVPVKCTTENNFVPYGNDLGIDKLPIRERLSTDNNIISTKVTTGSAPNNLEIINNTVEELMLFQKKIVMSREPLMKLMSSQIKVISHQLL